MKKNFLHVPANHIIRYKLTSGSKIVGIFAFCFVRWRFVERETDSKEGSNAEDDKKRIL